MDEKHLNISLFNFNPPILFSDVNVSGGLRVFVKEFRKKKIRIMSRTFDKFSEVTKNFHILLWEGI